MEEEEEATMCEREGRSKRQRDSEKARRKTRERYSREKRPEPHLTPRERNEREGGLALVKYKRRGCIYTFAKLGFIQLWESPTRAQAHTTRHGEYPGAPSFWGVTPAQCVVSMLCLPCIDGEGTLKLCSRLFYAERTARYSMLRGTRFRINERYTS